MAHGKKELPLNLTSSSSSDALLQTPSSLFAPRGFDLVTLTWSPDQGGCRCSVPFLLSPDCSIWLFQQSRYGRWPYLWALKNLQCSRNLFISVRPNNLISELFISSCDLTTWFLTSSSCDDLQRGVSFLIMSSELNFPQMQKHLNKDQEK